MKLRTSAIAAILGCAAVGVVGPAVGQSVIAQTEPVAVQPSSAQLTTAVAQNDKFIAAIDAAQDPSTAINAYADAKAAEPNNLAVQQSYLRKMIAFQLPEMAEAQARDIVNRDTRDPLAWAVLAYMHAKEDMTNQALTEIAVAVQRAPDDPFVMRTAGQLMAWYDIKADKSQIPEALKNSLENMRRDLAGRPIFGDTYAKAAEAYRATAATEPTPGTAGTTYVAPPVTTGYTPAPPVQYPQTDYGYPYYTDYGAPYYQPWYPYDFYPGVLIGFNNFGFRHHHHDGDRDHDHDHFGRHDDGLPLVHSHQGVGLIETRNSFAEDRSGVVTIRTPRRGIEAAEPSISTVSVRDENGAMRNIEVIRPTVRFNSSSPSLMESHVPSRLAVQGIRAMPMRSESIPMRSAPGAAPSGGHFVGGSPSISTGGMSTIGTPQSAGSGGRR